MDNKKISMGLRIIMCAISVAAIVVGSTAQVSAATYGYGGGPDCKASVVPPSRGFRFTINNGESYTYNRRVRLTMRGGSAAYMQVSNYSNFWDAPVVKYTTTTDFWLTYWPGYKTVYVRFFNACKAKSTGTISRSIYSYSWW